MNLTGLFSSSTISITAEVLLHSIWQGLIIAALLWSTLKLFKNTNPNVRYFMACTALCLSLLLPILTFIKLIPTESYNTTNPVVLSSAEEVSADTQASTAISLTQLTPETTPNTLNASATPAAVQPKSSFNLTYPWIVISWLIGVCLLSLKLLGAWLLTRHLKTRNIKLAERPLQLKLLDLAKKLELKKKVRLFESSAIAVPMVIGYMRPVILLPASTLMGLSVNQLEIILAHELAHIRRHDLLINSLQHIAETLFFYHPAVWWISKQIRIEREYCCDDLALKLSDSSTTDYAATLAQLESLRQQPQFIMAANNGSLLNRISRLLEPEFKKQQASNVWAFLTIITLLLAFSVWFNPKVVLAQVNENNFQVFDVEGNLINEETAPHAFQMIQEELKVNLGNAALSQALNVYSSISLQAQEAANNAAKNAEMPEGAQLALAAIDPETGGIAALIGGNPTESSYTHNRAISLTREAGSDFKSITYATAFEEAGLTQASIIIDDPISLTANGTTFAPNNHDNLFSGTATIRKHLDISRNIPAVKMLNYIPVENLVKKAELLGYVDVVATPSLSIGSIKTSPLQTSAAYAAFANGGIHIAPHIMNRVEDDKGSLLYEANPLEQRVWTEQTAYQILDLLHGNVIDPGAFSGRARLDGRWVGGKTGTTNNEKDIWFVGLTPGLVATTWIGYDDYRSIPKSLPAENAREDGRITSSRQPVYLWKDFAEAALRGQATSEYPVPEGIIFKGINLKTGEEDTGVIVALPSLDIDPTKKARKVDFQFDPNRLGLDVSNYAFRLEVTDDHGERTLIDRVFESQERVERSISIYGEASIKTYINDKLFQVWKP